MKSLDIAVISPTLLGGMGKVTITLAEEMRNRGMSVEIWAMGEHEQTTFDSNVQIRNIAGARASFTLFVLIGMLRKHKPKSAMSASYHLNCVVIFAKLLSQVKSKLVIVEHTSLTNGLETLSWLKRVIARVSIAVLYRLTNALVAVSNDAARQMERFAILPQNTVTTIYNPIIDESLYLKSQEKFTHPFNEFKENIFVSVGRLSEEKDYPTLIKAFAKTLKTRSSRLIIAGDGPEKNKIEELISELGLRKHVALLGHVKNPYPLCRSADVFVLSSKREGLPTVLIEALALDCKIVSTDARSGPREILDNGRLGTLVPVENVNALADAMIASLETTGHSNLISGDELLKYQVDYAVNQYLKLLAKKPGN